eukprot:2922197-Prymnesium_polylepis.1
MADEVFGAILEGVVSGVCEVGCFAGRVVAHAAADAAAEVVVRVGVEVTVAAATSACEAIADMGTTRSSIEYERRSAPFERSNAAYASAEAYQTARVTTPGLAADIEKAASGDSPAALR